MKGSQRQVELGVKYSMDLEKSKNITNLLLNCYLRF